MLYVKFSLIALFVASAVHVHLRGRVRHAFGRQLTDHSTVLAPVNALFYLFRRVPAKPFQDERDFRELRALTDNWQTIRDEGMRLLDEGYVRAAASYNDLGFNSFFRTGWKRFYLKWYADPLPSAERMCPKTVALLNAIPNVHGAMFACCRPAAVWCATAIRSRVACATTSVSPPPTATTASSRSTASAAAGATARR